MQDRFLQLFIDLYPLVAALTSMLVTQMLKAIYCYIAEDRLDLKKMFASGGMPSSHSAMVAALSTAIGLRDGLGSSGFCISVVFSIIVLYDSAGVRHLVGQQAILLNQMVDDLVQRGEFKSEKLSELLGHTPLEVIVGVLLGIGIAFTLYY